MVSETPWKHSQWNTCGEAFGAYRKAKGDERDENIQKGI